MRASWLIIDGYSLVHRDPDLASYIPGQFIIARQRLVQKLEEIVRDLADRTTIVFDGKGGGTSEAPESDLIQVLYAPKHMTADTVIERLVDEAAHPERVLVATSDRAELDTVSSMGAQTMSCGQFLETMKRRRGHHSDTAKRIESAPRSTLGDFFPDDG